MQLITPVSEQKETFDKKLLFLAGPIKGADNWQDKVIESLAGADIYIANPRREADPDFNYTEQVDWETKHLTLADVIMFWIPKETVHVEGRSYAQTTRFELAEWLAKTNYNRDVTKIVLGIEDGFYGKRYIVERLKQTNVKVYDSYEETLQKVKSLMKNPGRIFFTSDTHFDSFRALELSRRPFASVREMNAAIIYNWNCLITPKDKVYHLGDFGNLDYAKHLSGQIHLVLGNKEEEEIAQNPKYLDTLKSTFKSVEKTAVVELTDGTKVHLSHRPSDSNNKMFNAFGHIHGRQMCKKYGFDIGVDGNNFTPVSEERLQFFKDAIENRYDNEVFL